MGLLQKIFGTHSENELKRIYPIADAIEALEPPLSISLGQVIIDCHNVDALSRQSIEVRRKRGHQR